MSPANRARGVWLFLLIFSGTLPADAPRILSVKKIWDSAVHSASGDLIRYRGKWFSVFKEADGHASHHLGRQDNGKLRIIESANGDKWVSAALVAEEGVDLRDPHFSMTPDNRLMIVAGGSRWDKGGKYLGRRTRVLFSSDGRDWTQPRPILAEGDWLWRVSWHKGRAYGVSYHGGGGSSLPRKAYLHSSADGLHYEIVTELDVPGMNETTLRFLEGGQMVALARREYDSMRGWIGLSQPPYKQWNWREIGYRLGGPNFIELPDKSLWAGSRYYPPERPPGPGSGTTVLARMSRESYEPVLTLPSGGDTSYPGLVWHDDLLWMIYYSSHEGKASIYLAKIRLR